MATNYKAYPAYKDSGVEWLGEIPEGWEISKVKFLSYCLDGKRIPLNGVERGEKEGNIPYWGANSIVDYINDYLFNEDLILLGEDGAPFFDKSKDVAFYVQGKIWVNNHIHVLKPIKTKIDPRFITYSLNCVDFHLYISGSTRDKLNQSAMNDISLKICTLKEQQKIADFLDYETAKIDTLINKQETLIELLKEKRQAVISHAVTKGLDPNVQMKDSGVEWLGEVPEHWDVLQFRRFTYLSQGLQIPQSERFSTPSENRLEYITIKSINAGSNANFKEYIECKNKRVFCTFNDVLLARTGATGEVITNVKGIFHNNFFKINFNQNHIIKDFLFYLLKVKELKQYILMLAGTTTIPDLNHGDFLSTKITIPQLNEQKIIVKYLEFQTNKIDTLISKAEQAIELIKERKTALISAAVTGKIDVRDWQKP